MELAKQNLITFSLSEATLTKNFHLIELQFKKLSLHLKKLTKQSNLLVYKMNQIDPFDEIDNLFDEPSQDKEGSQDINISKQKQINQSFSQIDPQEIKEELSKTELEVKNQLDKIQNQQNANFKKRNGRESRDSFGENTRSNRRNFGVQKQQESKTLKAMHESLIRDLDQRVTALEEQRQANQDTIKSLNAQNEKIKGFLGMKKKEKTSKNISRKQKKESSIKQINKQSNKNEKQVSDSNLSSGDLESMMEENNFITSFSKELQNVKEILRDKSLIIDDHYKKLTKSISDNQNKNTEEIKSLWVKINELEEKDKDVSLILANQRNTRSNHTSNSFNRTNKSSFDMNDTMESYKNYYEDKIVQIFDEMDRIRAQYIAILEKMNEEGVSMPSGVQNMKEMQRMKSIALRINGKSSAMVDEKMKKDVGTIKREVKKIREQFDDLMSGINTGTNQTRTLIIKPNQTKEDWKNLSQKIFKLRQQLMGYIKELESKIFTNNQIISMTHELEIGLSECKILINKKVSVGDFEKTTKRIESRLNNFIKQVYEKEGLAQQQQALIAKQPWFCLSCDTQIKNQTGKIGKTLYGEKFTGKKVNPESHMIRRTETVSKLPTLHS